MTGCNQLALNDKVASFSAFSPLVRAAKRAATHHFVHKRHIWDMVLSLKLCLVTSKWEKVVFR